VVVAAAAFVAATLIAAMPAAATAFVAATLIAATPVRASSCHSCAQAPGSNKSFGECQQFRGDLDFLASPTRRTLGDAASWRRSIPLLSMEKVISSAVTGIQLMQPWLVHIGCNEFGNDGNEWTDTKLYLKVVAQLNATGLKPRLALVEPQPWNIPQIHSKLHQSSQLRSSLFSVQVVHAAIAADCPASGGLVMHGLNESLLPAVYLPIIRAWASTNHRHPLNALYGFAVRENCGGSILSPSECGKLKKLYTAARSGNLDTRTILHRFEVPCMSPKKLLEEINAVPHHVAWLNVDAEGLAKEIVGEFLKLAGFAPQFLMYEQGPSSSPLTSWAANSSHRYAIGLECDNPGEDNMIAVPAKALALMR